MAGKTPEKQLLRDAVVVTVLGGLLVALPLTKDSWGDANLANGGQVADDKEFIREVFPVVSSWEMKKIEPYFSDKTLTASGNGVEQVFDTLAITLGDLESFSEPTVAASESNFNLQQMDNTRLSSYHLNASFERGEAEVEIVLEGNDTSTEIYAVNFETL